MALIEGARAAAHREDIVPRRFRLVVGPWQLCGGVLALAAFSLVSLLRVPDFDYWWHLADGRYMVAAHRLPVPDPFSFTAAGQHWVAHEWLAELAMYGLHRVLGDRGPLMFFGVCAAMAVALAFDALRRAGVRFAAANIWTVLTLLALVGSIGPRPEVAAFALMAVDVWLIERWIARRDASIWCLPLLLCLWVNVHGSWPAGIALPLLVLVGDLLAVAFSWPGAGRLDAAGRRRLGAALAVSLVAVFANANGIAGVLYPLTHFHSPLNDHIAGNQATALNAPYTWPFFLLTGTYLAMVIVRRPRLPAADLLVAAAFLVAALWTWRLVPFAALCLVPLAGHVLAQPNESGMRAPHLLARIGAWHDRWERKRSNPSPARQWLNAALLLFLVVSVVSRPPYDIARVGRQPVEAVDVLGAAGLPGPLLNEDTWGGYLIWRLWPRTRVFIDDRGVDLYSNGQVFRGYLQVLERTPEAEAVLDSYGVRTVLVRKDWPPVADLLASGKWRITYQDGVAVKLERGPER